MLEAVSALSRLASRLALMASAAGLAAMTLIVGWQVFARYMLNAAPPWTEQAALLLMLWFILFAAAAGVRESFHIRLSLLEDLVPAPVRRGVRVLAHLVVLVFGAVMAVSGAELALATWSHVIPTLGLPRGVAYMPLSGAGGLIAFFALEHILADIVGREVKPLWS
ncbi:TRAP transporter small permease [Maricaulis sp.]|uniref:TRAP transporter small permease n=1 Tax=Maricaulis sp. TaxID=1486257 RepID=UPI00262154B1|nr:TRAP transporter small permease [Maricaulis sp.]